MLGTPFTHDMIRKYVVAFGTMFNNIKLQRADPVAGDTQWISVPLSYAPKEKWHARLTDPRITQQVAISLPRISYELVTATYASERKMNTMNRHVAVATDQDKLKNMFAPVPYDFQFSLFIYSRNAADASNIIEQILPFFTPEFTVTINDATDLKIDIDCPIVLNGVNREDTYEGDFESRRVVTWTLDFTMKGLLFGPVRESKVIKKAYIDFFIPPTDSRTVYHSGTLAATSNVHYYTAPQNLTTLADQVATLGPFEGSVPNVDISPDGKKFLFASNKGLAVGVFEIFVADMGTGLNSLQLTTQGVGIRSPKWSPDGTHVLFDRGNTPQAASTFEIYSMDIGSQVSPAVGVSFTNLSASASIDWHCNWSPDGTHIVFSSKRAGGDVIHTMDIGSQTTPTPGTAVPISLTGADTDSYPAWHPNGTQIAMSSSRSGDSEVWLMNVVSQSTPVACTSPTQVTTDAVVRHNMSWDPTANVLAYSSNITGTPELYTINADGSNVHQITTPEAGSTRDFGPSWSSDGGVLAFSCVVGGVYTICQVDRYREVLLQTNTASRTSNTYDSGTITIIGEGSDNSGITGNTRTLHSYDGNRQRALVLPNFTTNPANTWTYEIQYLTADRSSSISTDQLLGIPTATRIYTQPGLTVAGDPTSNGLGSGTPADNPLYYTLSVDVDEIDAGEDYGIIQTRTFFPSNNVLAGTRRNLKTGDDE